MKRIIFVAIVIVAVIAGAACSKDKVKPSGNIVKYPVDIPEFNSIVIDNSFNAQITIDTANDETFYLQVDENISPYVVTKVVDNTLYVSLKDATYKGSFTLQAIINMHKLTTIELKDASLGSIAGKIKENIFKAVVSDASTLHITELSADSTYITLNNRSGIDGYVNAKMFQMNMDGASSSDISGSASKLKLYVYGASVFYNFRLSSSNSIVEAREGSVVGITVSDTLNVCASGASCVSYIGSPVLFSDLYENSTCNKL